MASVAAHLVSCTKCRALLGAELFNLPDMTPCPSCAVPLQAAVFPALFREETVVPAEPVAAEGEAGCFYHAEKKATVVCGACGRFLCALCDVDFNGQHLCPACLETGRHKGKIKNLQNSRLRHDKIALALAVFPVLIFYFTVFTAPVALAYAIRHWNSPSGLTPHRPKLNLSIAMTLASLQIIGWAFLFVFLFTR